MNDVAIEVPEKASRWEDFIDVYFSPAELFARRKGESWLKAFLIFALVSATLYYIFLPINALMWEAAMLENAPPDASAEQLRQSAAFMKYLGGLFMLGYIFVVTLFALGMKVGSSLLEPSARWSDTFLIATLASYVTILQQVLGTAVIYFVSRTRTFEMSDASFGPLRFMPDASPVMKAVLGRFDLFALWTAALCAVGLIVIVGMPRGRAAATAAMAWLIAGIPPVFGALMQGAK